MFLMFVCLVRVRPSALLAGTGLVGTVQSWKWSLESNLGHWHAQHSSPLQDLSDPLIKSSEKI